MTLHRIGAATLAATLLAAPVSAQTTTGETQSTSPTAERATLEDAPSQLRTRLGMPDATAAGWERATLLVYAPPPRVAPPAAPARAASERGDAGARSVVFRQQAEPVSWPWGWTLRGFIGGLVAGPIGTGIAFHMAGNSDVTPAQVAAADGAASAGIDPAYIEAVRSRRKEASFVGGMVGTAAFLYAALVVFDIDGSGDGSFFGDPRDPDPGF